MKTVSAAEANRHFSNLLRDVATGETITVLSRGKPVATIARAHGQASGRQHAKQRLLKRLQQQQSSGVRDWTRDDLYQRRAR